MCPQAPHNTVPSDNVPSFRFVSSLVMAGDKGGAAISEGGLLLSKDFYIGPSVNAQRLGVFASLEPAISSTTKTYVEFAIDGVDGGDGLAGICCGVIPRSHNKTAEAHMFNAGAQTHIEKNAQGAPIQKFLEVRGVSGFTPRSDQVGDRVGLLVDCGRLFVYFNGRQAFQRCDRLDGHTGSGIIIDGLPAEIRFAVSFRDLEVGNRVRIVQGAPEPAQAPVAFRMDPIGVKMEQSSTGSVAVGAGGKPTREARCTTNPKEPFQDGIMQSKGGKTEKFNATNSGANKSQSKTPEKHATKPKSVDQAVDGGYPGPCTRFAATGSCKFGEKCRFSHGQGGDSDFGIPTEIPVKSHGIGLGIMVVPPRCVVTELVPGGPSKICKQIVPGDEIIAIDGTEIVGLDLAQVTGLVLGPSKSKVLLTLRRPSPDNAAGAIINVPLVRTLPYVNGTSSEAKTLEAGVSISSRHRTPIDGCEVFVCASCPQAHQDEVSGICRSKGIQKAFGKAGDMVDSLSGSEWLGKWEAKVVMATVTKAQTLGVRKARILCISGGPHCDLEVAQQPRLVRAIKQEMADNSFAVKVEWMEIQQFREEYGGGVEFSSAVPGTSVVGADDCRKQGAKSSLDSKRAHSGSNIEPNGSPNTTAFPGSPFAGADASKKQGHGGKSSLDRKQSGSDSKQIGTEKNAQDNRARGDRQGTGKSQKQLSAKTHNRDGCLWSCIFCGKNFQTQQAVEQHQRGTGHLGIQCVQEEADSDSDSDVWVCGECEQEFATAGACNQHQSATGHCDPACTCGKEFGSKNALRQHKISTGHL